MHRLSKIAFLGMFALTMAGCESGSQEISASKSAATPSAPQMAQKQPATKTLTNKAPATKTPATKAVAAKTPAAKTPATKTLAAKTPATKTPATKTLAAQAPATQPFEKQPLVAQNFASAVFSTPGLIQSTNPEQRAKQVRTGRQDPFAAISVPVSIKRQTTVAKPVAPKPTPVSPPVIPTPPVAAVLPPQPDLAKGIGVVGVVQIGDETQAIVQAPNELTSRYVRVGDRLANGQVLVKRIEVNQGPAPIVILEQFGMEIARAVGEKPAPQTAKGTTTGTTTGAMPTPPPPPGKATSQQFEEEEDIDNER